MKLTDMQLAEIRDLIAALKAEPDEGGSNGRLAALWFVELTERPPGPQAAVSTEAQYVRMEEYGRPSTSHVEVPKLYMECHPKGLWDLEYNNPSVVTVDPG